jgi:hypothetical protein
MASQLKNKEWNEKRKAQKVKVKDNCRQHQGQKWQESANTTSEDAIR